MPRNLQTDAPKRDKRISFQRAIVGINPRALALQSQDTESPRAENALVPLRENGLLQIDNEQLTNDNQSASADDSARSNPSKRRSDDTESREIVTYQPQVGSKRRKTAQVAYQPPCCSCSKGSTCSTKGCTCVNAGKPCLNCDPGCKCTNTYEVHNRRIKHNSRLGSSSTANRLRQHMGLQPHQPKLLVPPEDYPNKPPPSSSTSDESNKSNTLQQSTTAVGSGSSTSSGSNNGDDTDGSLLNNNNTSETAEEGGNASVVGTPSTPLGGTPNRVPANAQAQTTGGAAAAGEESHMSEETTASENEGRDDGGGVHGTTPAVRGDGGDDNNGETTTRFEHPIISFLRKWAPERKTEEQLREEDSQLQQLTDADRKLISLYGDTIHQNDGSHLHGGIDAVQDRKMQRLWQKVAGCKLPLYDIPNGKYAQKFLETLTSLFRDVRERKCNSEVPLIYCAVILRKKRNAKGFKETKPLIWARMKAWDDGKICALVNNVMDDAAEEGWGMGLNRESDIESDGKRFNSTLLDGEIRAAVRNLTNRGQSGLLAPDDIDSKTGNKVINVLQAKHPEPVIPSIDHFDQYDDAQEGEGLFDVLDTLYYEDDVAKAARRLSGGAGPCGVKSRQLKDWLLRFGAHSEALRVEMGMMATWLTNSAVPYAAIRALNAVRLLAGNKDPGVRPIGCGEVFMRLLADCDHIQSKGKATTVCGNVQLCAGLSSGIEANLHAVRAIFPRSAGWEHDEGIVEEEEDDEDVDNLSPTPNPDLELIRLSIRVQIRVSNMTGIVRTQALVQLCLMLKMHSTR